MERFLIDELTNWKASKRRKPLILRGIRQCGKTWALKEFGRRCYKNTAYISFDEEPEYKQFFTASKDVKRIITNLSMALGVPITAADTLIIFDEIQECPQALAALKYFCEDAPALALTAFATGPREQKIPLPRRERRRKGT
jgi:predicted AAA+ superfamily ATPase